jgi:hypothetical protein
MSGNLAETAKAIVNHAVWLRGTVITNYAHIEFLLADICVKAWQQPQYRHLSTSFPYKTETRIKAVRELFDADGPLQKHRSGVDPALDELLNFEELRHFIAHGLMIVTPYLDDPKLEYRLYQTKKEGYSISFKEVTASELTEISKRISELQTQLLISFRAIYSELKLEFNDN